MAALSQESAGTELKDGSLLERRHRVLGESSPLFYEEPVHIVRGEGVWLHDTDGRRYLDAYNNVPHVGHCHPRVVEAIARQTATLNVHTRYLHDNIVEYAERLTALFDDPLTQALFACTGSEANDVAMQMARLHTGNSGFIAMQAAYHGNTIAVSAISSPAARLEGIAVSTVPAPDTYRLPPGFAEDDPAEAYARTIGRAIDALEAEGAGVAAIIFDTVFSSEGLPEVPAGYVSAAVEQVRAAGGLYIADEVQPGFGRMGDHLWGYRHYGTVPDIVTLGKPMANGYPVSAVVAREDLVREFGRTTAYFNTFGGNPVGCAAALAVLDVLEDENLVAHAHDIGQHLHQGLRALQARHAIIGDVRGRGLFLAAELVRDRRTQEPAPEAAAGLANAMRRRGILIGTTGAHENVLKLRPPMPFTREHADMLLTALDECLAERERR